MLRFIRRPRRYPTEAIGNPVDVRIDADVPRAAVRQDEDEVGGLASHARQRQQLLHCRRHPSAEARHDLFAGLRHVDSFVPVEAGRVNQPFDLLHVQLQHRARRARHAEEPRGCGSGHRVLGLRRQHRRNQDLERILVLIPRDFLDCRRVEAVDRLGQPAHDRSDPSTRHDGLNREWQSLIANP